MLWMWLSVLLPYVCGAKDDENFKSLELPANYEEIMPEVLKQAGIPTNILPIGDGLVASSMSKISNGLGYLKFWGDGENEEACESVLKAGQQEVTKRGRTVCKKQCLEKHKDKVSFMKNALEIIAEDSEDIVVDDEINPKKKLFECVSNGIGYDCVCLQYEVLKVSPGLQALVSRIFHGDKRREVVPDHSTKKIVALIALNMAEKMVHVAAKSAKPFTSAFSLLRRLSGKVVKKLPLIRDLNK